MITYHEQVCDLPPVDISLIPATVLSQDILELLYKHNPNHVGLIGIKQHNEFTLVFIQTYNEYDRTIGYDRIDIDHSN